MKLLIIEDSQRHQESAKKFFAEKGISVSFMKTLKEFDEFWSKKLKNKDTYAFDASLFPYDGVLSDIFFPDDENSEAVPAGVAVFIACQSKGFPCVLVTDGFHHGKKYQWICRMTRLAGMPSMVDNGGLLESYEAEAPEKDWALALLILIRIIDGQK